MRLVPAVIIASSATIVAWGMFRPPSNAPVERLVANVETYVKNHPREAQGYYTLGRIHYLAFALKAKSIEYFEYNGIITPYNQFRPGRAPQPSGPGDPEQARQRAHHLSEALRGIKKALELEPQNGLFELGLACVYEDGQAAAGGPDWREEAIRHYLAAYRLSIDDDQKITSKPLTGLGALVSYEAGHSYIRLVQERGLKDQDGATVRSIELKIAAFEKLPRGPITPIVLSLGGTRSLNELIDSGARVAFDLDGTGRSQVYSWPRADMAFLVWDPERTGRVTSGRQLFGTVTWWMFWENGYQAMAALDDDHDGSLSGRELAGLALWFDRNGNGVSDPGEVIPIEDAGVEALAVEADGRDGASPMNAQGVRMKDGRVLATWDWVVVGRR